MKLNLRRAISSGVIAMMIMTLAVVAPQKTYAASENLEDAVSIEIGQDVEGSIASKDEEAWYTFTTPETESGADSWFKITELCSNFKNGGDFGPRLYLYNKKQQELCVVKNYGENAEEEKCILLEQQSTYYIKMEYSNVAADYSFKVTELPDEAGDKLEKAADLKKNMTNRFAIQTMEDEDWFHVESNITKPALTVKNANSDCLDFEIYDVDGVMLKEFSVYKAESKTMQLSLEEKNFYIRVDAGVTNESHIGNYTVAVNDKISVTKVSLNKTTAELRRGKTLILKATITPSNVANKTVTWKSSNSSIATVDKNGKVTAKKAGIVTITCTANDGSKKSATCRITVK